MVVIFGGMVRVSSELRVNAPCPMDFRPEGIFNSSMLLSRKASLPMVSTESGIETELSPLPQKALASMDFTPGGMVTEGIRLL